MCTQCAAGASSAVAAVGGAAGLRSWLGARGLVWMTPARMRLATILLTVLALLGASVGLSSS